MADNTVVDPVCGMKLDSSKARFISDYDGMRYYFCSENCKHRFGQGRLALHMRRRHRRRDSQPARYRAGRQRAPGNAAT